MRGHNNAVMCASTEGPGSLFQSRQPILEIRTRKGPNFSWHRDPTGTLNAQNRDPKIRVINQLFQLYIFSSSFTINGWGEDDVRACVFGVFRALNILNGYV